MEVVAEVWIERRIRGFLEETGIYIKIRMI